MNRATWVLLGVAILYPVTSWWAMWATSGVSRIPTPGHLMLLGFVCPICVVAVALAAKGAGARLPGWVLAVFAAWMAAVGVAHAWFISAVWAII